jgi:hypothetical protein
MNEVKNEIEVPEKSIAKGNRRKREMPQDNTAPMQSESVGGANILATAIKYRSVVGKRYQLDSEDNLIKLGTSDRTDDALAIVNEFSTPREYFEWSESLGADTMQTAGSFLLSKDGEAVRLSSKASDFELTATKSHLNFRPQAGVLLIDVDYKDRSEVEGLYPENPKRISTQSALRELLLEIAPGVMSKAAMRICDSSSSNLYVDGKQVTGVKGLHAEIIVSDASRIPSILKAMHHKLWAIGYGWAFVSRGGTVLMRSPVDLAMANPTQPFFGAATFLSDRIEQRCDSTIFDGGVVDVTELMSSLAVEDSGVVAESESVAKSALKQVSNLVREKKVEEQVEAYVARTGVSIQVANRELKEAYKGCLPCGMEIITTAGEVLTVGDLWSGKYDGLKILYPLEPDYVCSSYVRYDSEKRPVIHSFAHGYHTLGIAKPPIEIPAEFEQSFRDIIKTVFKAIGDCVPTLYLDSEVLLHELKVVVRAKSKTNSVLRMHQLHNGTSGINYYTKTEYLNEVLDVGKMIISQNLPGDPQTEYRMGNYIYLMGFERISAPEANRVHKALGTVWARVAKSLREGISEFLLTERQVDEVNYRVDMFEQSPSLKVEQVSSIKQATIIQTHKPFDTKQYEKFVSERQYKAIVADYKDHFVLLDELLEVLTASRFASDGRKAFLWMRAPSSFGKSFIAEGVLGQGLPGMGAGLGLVMPLNMKQVEAAFDGAPSSISPAEFSHSWIAHCDEFSRVNASLKELNNTLRVSPKNQMQGRVRLYLKLFTSAEDVQSLASGGVEAQLANRFSYWGVQAGKLDQRPLYDSDQFTYLQAVRLYVARFLNDQVGVYKLLGLAGAAKEADRYLTDFHTKYRISETFGTLEDEIKHIAGEFREKVYKMKVKCEGLSNSQNQFERLMLSSTVIGYSDPDLTKKIAVVRNPNKVLEVFIKETTSYSELVKINARKTELLEAIGEVKTGRKQSAQRVYYMERDRRVDVQIRGLVFDCNDEDF